MSERQYNSEIKSFDIHTYYFQSFDPSRQEAIKLREKLQEDFAQEIKEGKLRVYQLVDRPIGPHPYAMFECDFATPEIYAKVVPWYQLHHGSLSVLVHPHTGDAVKDHTDHAIWIGKQVPLIVTMLRH